MEHLAIVLWLALAPCQGSACDPAAWHAAGVFPGADLCEAVAERAAGGQCLPRGWRPLAAPGADFIPRTWRAAI
ncbi:hypothetical protein LCGC14_2897030 [marine sediment metagenome]|uniref:Uncharacterized protein n=1 Tax=marine sediment metagenome TaxID=412755 RepID=A0A0F8XVX9_9ZZZZ